MTEHAPKSNRDAGQRFEARATRLPSGLMRFRSLPVALLIATLMALLHLTPFARQIEDRYGLGLLFHLRGPISPPDGALVAAIDKQSIDWLRRISLKEDNAALHVTACLPASSIAQLERLKGPSSLPRPIYACLLRELRRVGFPVVAFDILFSVRGDAAGDQMLAHELRSHGATAILSGYERFAIKKGGAELVVEQNRQPLPLFKDHAAATGSFLVPRTGGFVHGYLRTAQELGGAPNLVDEALALTGQKGVSRSPAASWDPEFQYLWLYGPPSAVLTVPIRDLLTGEMPEHALQAAKNTVVFVGASDPSVARYPDSFPSLFRNELDANISGVEILATAFLNQKNGHTLRQVPWLVELAVVFVFALALGLVVMTAGSRSVLGVVGLALAYVVTVALLFAHHRLYLPAIGPVFVAAPLCAVLALMMKSRRALALIMRLAPAPMARRMLAEPSGDPGAVVTSDATVAFFDVIDSSAIGEKIGNLTFGKLMNEFHDAVTREVERHGGFVTAFTGDGVTALFERATAGSDHAHQACRAALSSTQKLRALNQNNAAEGLPSLGVRVGINSGMIAAGGIGAQDRFNFDVVGDAVNIAARLEQLGKTLFPRDYDVILVGTETHARVHGDGLPFDDCGMQQIPGRQKPENVFRLRNV